MIIGHPDCILYDPKHEFDGTALRQYPENPGRISSILAEIGANNLTVEPARDFGNEWVSQLHDSDYIEFLQSVPSDIGEAAPTAFNIGGRITNNSSFYAKLGHYLYDPATPLTTHSYSSAMAAVNCALTAADALLNNQNLTFTVARPPGHHVSYKKGGGYGFFNQAAIAAYYVRRQGKQVSILDLDFHHGNGTQALFYDTDEVQYVSIHGDPEVCYPYYWGYVDEIGESDGKGFTRNYPIGPLSTDDQFMDTLDDAILTVIEYNPDILIVSMGYDTYLKDPIAGMAVTLDGYERMGAALQQFSKVAVILEGGYHVPDLGQCFMKFYKGLKQ